VGRTIVPEDTVQLAEEKRLGDLRRSYVEQDDALLKAAVGFTEGGGARLFREGAKLNGNTVNKMTAKAMKLIWEDEKDHYFEQAKSANNLIKNQKDLVAMKQAIVDVSLQRVWMRNEMFRQPMTPAEIERFIKRNQKKLTA